MVISVDIFVKLYVIINIIINEPNRWSDCESTILLY